MEKPFYYKYKFSFKPEINYQKEFKKIALICTKPIGIGDLIMDTPFIKTLRKFFPDSKIHLITDKDIFDKVREIDKIILVSNNFKKALKTFYDLRKYSYDLGIIMNKALIQNFFLEALNPRYKLGYIGGWKIVSNFKLKHENLIFTKNEHFWNMALKIAKTLGIDEKYWDNELIEVDFSDTIKKRVKKIYASLNLDTNKRTIALNTFSLWKTRRWDKDNYVKLIEKIYRNFNIILYGGSDAIETSDYIEKKLKTKGISVKNVTGKLKLKEAIYFLKFIDLFVTPDSGPMHFAFLMRTPTLALFGPVNPLFRIPKNMKNYKTDYIWIKDYINLEKEYNYEYEYIERNISNLKLISVSDVEKKIYKLMEN